ncbi:hypothetical protein [Acinetobacter gerneri]|jgi:hypothetical protein|uniref:hypothetical protein n=1 Tax=Acinetobacter gerneri TaxID=202952 RepID=UPI0023F25B7E|nr:hypothetical protein [Acinetobacter gerneri]MCH4242695.1 hypothetical protein [Acinetobacter gerneri]
MFNKLSELFKSNKESAEQVFLRENDMKFDEEQGYIINGRAVNELSERLIYFSNRKLSNFDDLKALFYTSILMNEKIDLEIASGRYVARLGNTQENLLEFKEIIRKLNDYYREFKRDKS